MVIFISIYTYIQYVGLLSSPELSSAFTFLLLLLLTLTARSASVEIYIEIETLEMESESEARSTPSCISDTKRLSRSQTTTSLANVASLLGSSSSSRRP